MWHNANLSLNVAFFRNDPHATSTAGWRLITFPCGMSACVTPRETSHSPKGSLVNIVRSCFFRPPGRFRDGLARPILAPLASHDGESTGDLRPRASPSPSPRGSRGALSKLKKSSQFRGSPLPAPRGRAGDVKPILRQRHARKKKVQSIPYIHPMNSDLQYDPSTNTPHT